LLHNGYGYAKIEDSRPSRSDPAPRFTGSIKFLVAWLDYDAGYLERTNHRGLLSIRRRIFTTC
jgi:hypothetical protein